MTAKEPRSQAGDEKDDCPDSRLLAVEGGVNFRDAGGIEIASSKRVRDGVLYRSGTLAKLTDDGVRQLGELGIGSVFDLRSDDEVRRAPDRLPDGIVYKHRPIIDPSRVSRLRAIYIVLFQRNRLVDALLEGYTRVMIDANGAIIGEMLRELAETDKPMLVHCTAGKDRTGLFVALLLDVLGVPRETILADYALSSQFAEQFAELLGKDIGRLRRIGFSEEQIRPILIADPLILQKTFDYIEQRYSSILGYLDIKAAVDATQLNELRDKLLAKSGD